MLNFFVASHRFVATATAVVGVLVAPALAEPKQHKMSDSEICDCADGVVKAKSNTIKFDSQKIYEIVYFTVGEGKQKQLDEEYFPVSMPIAAEYGGFLKGMFKVEDTHRGALEGEMVGIFEWKDMSAYEAMHKDERFLKVVPILQDSIAYFKTGFFSPAETTKVEFSNQKSYEFFGAWIKSKEKLNEYFQESTPLRASYGRPAPKFVLSLGAVEGQNPEKNIVPHMAGIVEWSKSEDYVAYTTHKDFLEKSSGLFEEAVEMINVVNAKPLIQ